jgi:hypothetical protein
VSAEPYTLGAFRGCDAHDRHHGISYTAITEASGPDVVAAMIAAGDRAAMLCPVDRETVRHPGHGECYAVLDIRNYDGDVVNDRCIPTREAFDWWERAIELRCESSDCPVDTPEAHAATRRFVDAAFDGDHLGAADIQLALVHGGAS